MNQQPFDAAQDFAQTTSVHSLPPIGGSEPIPEVERPIDIARFKAMVLSGLCVVLGLGLLLALNTPQRVAHMWAQRAVPPTPPAVLASPGDVRALTEQVMTAIGSADVRGGYSAMLPYSVLSGEALNTLFQNALSQRGTDDYVQRYGQTLGYEFVASVQPSSSLLRLAYVEKAARQPIPWVFYFYRNQNGWVLSEFSWGGRLFEFYRSF